MAVIFSGWEKEIFFSPKNFLTLISLYNILKVPSYSLLLYFSSSIWKLLTSFLIFFNLILLILFKSSESNIFDIRISKEFRSTNILSSTVNGIRFSLKDGSWGLIRASSNKPSLVVVTESTTSDSRKKRIFEFIDNLLKNTGKIGEYDQKI